MTDCDNQYESICRDEFAKVHRKLDKLDEAVRGNGKPGILIRLDRLEQDAKRQAKLTWLLIGATVAGGVSFLVRWMVS